MNPTTSLIHADIFFFITTICLLILTSLLIIFFYYIVKIARHLEHTTKKLREEGDRIIEDISSVRESFEQQGSKISSVLKLIFGSFFGQSKSWGNNESDAKTNKKSKKTTSKTSRKLNPFADLD